MIKPKVSIIMSTYNRLHLIGDAIRSVLNQTYRDFELIIIDDCPGKRAAEVVKKFEDKRIIYVKHKQQKGGSAARNTGIRMARGDFIGFIDDDDEWLPEKLEIQMNAFERTPVDVGYCFSAAITIKNDEVESTTKVPEGIDNFYERALRSFNGFLGITLMVKKTVIEDVGYWDEAFPSHQEIEWVLRISKKYKGLSINKPLVRANMRGGHTQIGKNLKKRIIGREMILKKHYNEFRKRPKILAKHYFQLALFYRDDEQFKQAKKAFKKILPIHFKIRYFLHYLSMFLDGRIYKLIKK